MRTPLALAAAALPSVLHAQVTFTVLPILPNCTGAGAAGVSANGTVVALTCEINGSFPEFFPARWTQAGGLVGLSVEPYAGDTIAKAISASGTRIVGGTARPIAWDLPQVVTPLLGAQDVASAEAVSADGQIIAGYAGIPFQGDRAVRWVSGQMEILSPSRQTWGYGISGDGSVVCGDGGGAWRWTASSGLVSLPLPAGTGYSGAYGVSRDGSTIVGTAKFGGQDQAVRWRGGQPQTLWSGGRAYGANADGSVVFGMLLTPVGRAVLWREGSGLIVLQDYLTSHGVTLPGGGLTVSGVSDNGLTVVGELNVGGTGYRAYVATLLSACYADCNGDESLTLSDFGCFQTKFALGDPYADCNGDGVRNLSDFGCFQTKFALGCP